jgi:hypothetical protein
LEVLDEHPSVVTVFAGHDHSGGYRKRNGVHHLTFPSPLSAPADSPFAHAIVDVHPEKLVINGYGIVCGVAPDLFTETGRSGLPCSAAFLEFPPIKATKSVVAEAVDEAAA